MTAAMLLVLSLPILGSEGQEVLDRISHRVSANVRNMPRYTCEETIERSWFDNNILDRSDRIRLDVAVGDAGEMFTWHGDRNFRSGGIDELIQSGPISSGTFSSFLNNIFSPGKAQIKFHGEGSFTYAMPLDRSSFVVGTPSGKILSAYDGSFAADPVSGRLTKLQIHSDSLPRGSQMSSLDMRVSYFEAKLGESEVELPTTVTMDVADLDRGRTRSITTYKNCHQFLGESVIRFDDFSPEEEAAKKAAAVSFAMPAGRTISIRLLTSLQPVTAWAGDPVEGLLLTNIPGVVPKGAKVTGHILRAESVKGKRESYNIDFMFDELFLEGAAHSIHLESLSAPTQFQRDRMQLTAGTACRFKLAYKKEAVKNVLTYWKSL